MLKMHAVPHLLQHHHPIVVLESQSPYPPIVQVSEMCKQWTLLVVITTILRNLLINTQCDPLRKERKKASQWKNWPDRTLNYSLYAQLAKDNLKVKTSECFTCIWVDENYCRGICFSHTTQTLFGYLTIGIPGLRLVSKNSLVFWSLTIFWIFASVIQHKLSLIFGFLKIWDQKSPTGMLENWNNIFHINVHADWPCWKGQSICSRTPFS